MYHIWQCICCACCSQNRFFFHFSLFGFLTSVARRIPLDIQELVNLNSTWVNTWVLVGFLLLNHQWFVDHCLYFCPSSFGHGIVCPSSFGHSIVCPSFGHSIVCPSFFGHSIFCPSSFGHSIVCPSISHLWLPPFGIFKHFLLQIPRVVY